MPKLVTIHFGTTNAKLIDPDKELERKVADIISYQPEGTKDYTPNRASFYRFRTKTFPSGFVRLVKAQLERAGYKVKLRSRKAPDPVGPLMPVVDSFPADPRYDFQDQSVERMTHYKRGIVQVATGGGKSRIFKLVAKRIDRPFLFLTTRRSLMYQMHDDYKANFPTERVGILGDSIWEPNPKGGNFAVVATLAQAVKQFDVESEMDNALFRHKEMIEKKQVDALRKLKLPFKPAHIKKLPKDQKAKVERVRATVARENALNEAALIKKIETKQKKQEKRRVEVLEFLRSIEFVTLEEAHEVGSESFFNILSACPNAHYRMGLTATPFMKEQEEANMRLMAVTGPVIQKVSEKLLIDRGILSKPYFKFIKPPKAPGMRPTAAWQMAYKQGVVESAPRNRAIVAEVKRAKQYGLSVMVLIGQVKHGKDLAEMFEDNSLKCMFISGDSSQSARQEALNELGKGRIDVLIGTNILDVGVDVPSVGMVIKAGGGQEEVAGRQRIGRGLRAKKSGPNVCLIVDFNDQGNKHLIKHSIKRRQIVDKTPGFAEGVISGDFDYEGLGFTLRS